MAEADPHLLDPFGRSRLPTDDMAWRVWALDEVFRAGVERRLPDPVAAAFVGSAGLSWLENGGDPRRFFRVNPRAGSHHNATFVWRRLRSSRGATSGEGSETMAPDEDDRETAT